MGTEKSKTMVVFFIVNTATSMEGDKIRSLNCAIRELIPEINDICKSNPDALVKIAVLDYSTGARWVTSDSPVLVDKFYWNNLEAGGRSDFGAMCKALNEKLSRKVFLAEPKDSYAPVIFLFTDTEPTDDWKKELDLLKQNNWFKTAIKVGIPIGDEADQDVLTEFTGSSESVFTCHNPQRLAEMVRFKSINLHIL